jgi:hypothetical protein
MSALVQQKFGQRVPLRHFAIYRSKQKKFCTQTNQIVLGATAVPLDLSATTAAFGRSSTATTRAATF